MKNPFLIRDDEISDSRLSGTFSREWVEGIAPETHGEIDNLRPSLKIGRVGIALIFVFLVFTIFLGRGFELQIIHQSKYRNAAETNRLRITRLPAPRGAILDRNGIPLTRNVPKFQLVLNPLDLPRDSATRAQIFTRLAELTGIPADELKSQATVTRLPVSPLALRTNLTIEEIYPLVIASQNIPGVRIETFSAREYTGGDAFAHILGYLGRINEENKIAYLDKGYMFSDRVGISGIEAMFESALHGRDGRKYVEVDATGTERATVATEEAISGDPLTLTIDAELQRAAANALQHTLTQYRKARGAVIVIDPHSGEILALVSLPTFDNNAFGELETASDARVKIFSDPNQPLFFRAISGTYPSGSTIKLAIAAAALQEKLINRTTSFLSTGGLRVGQWFFPDWKAGGHGITNVTRALAESINTFFYIIGGGYNDLPGLGIDRLTQYLTRFGFGATTGVDFFGEAAGLVPTPQWKKATRDEIWYIGDTYHLAIGQGDFLVTPLQITRMTAYFASSGLWTRPHVVVTPALSAERESTQCCNGPAISPQNIEIVRQGMREAVQYGSARALLDLPITSAGKTGTAQWATNKSPHAWFTGFAPYANPQIALTVLVEEGGEGSAVALPIAKQIIQWWHTNRMKNTDLTQKLPVGTVH